MAAVTKPRPGKGRARGGVQGLSGGPGGKPRALWLSTAVEPGLSRALSTLSVADQQHQTTVAAKNGLHVLLVPHGAAAPPHTGSGTTGAQRTWLRSHRLHAAPTFTSYLMKRQHFLTAQPLRPCKVTPRAAVTKRSGTGLMLRIHFGYRSW